MGSFPVLQEKRRSGKGGGEGVTPSIDTIDNNNSRVSTPTPGTTGFSDDSEIHAVVQQLYDIFTHKPGIAVQMQIDRYLFAASAAVVAECGGDAHTCVLMESQVPCLFNLPDMVYILRNRLIRGSWTNALQETVCRYTIPGMQKSRWVTRQRKTPTGAACAGADTSAAPASEEAPYRDSSDASLSAVYLNTLMGLLLGLYPQCSKRPGFNMRVRIVCAVRALLTSSVQVQTSFILKHVSLLRLAMVEYFANVLELYCPVEYKLLQRHVDICAYMNLCRSSCDLFRVNNLSEGLQQQGTNAAIDWVWLDSLAYKMTDKIIRSTRVESKLVNHVELHHKSIKKLVSSEIYKQPAACDEFLTLVKGCAIAYCQDDHSYLYQQMLSDAAAVAETSSESIRASIMDLNVVVADIHSIIHATMLPANFVRAQIQTLRQIYEFDPIQLMVASKKRICLHCILRIAPKQFALEEKINGNIRMELDTDEIYCNRCMSSAHIISIDLIGRIIRINQSYIYICIQCGGAHEWQSDGCDLLKCPAEPKRRIRLRALLNDEKQDTEIPRPGPVSRKCRTHCFICKKLCTGHGLWVVHVAGMRMIHIDLCSTHLPPPHMLQYIVDTADYTRWQQNTETRGGSARKKRRG
jgi:hypothetical protein